MPIQTAMANGPIMGCIRGITVEPVAFFTFFGLVVYQLVRDTGLYRIVCYQKYGSTDRSSIDCKDLSGNPDAENYVQKTTTLWIMAYSLAVLLPAMFTDILLGAWGDRRGRKTNMLLGIVGTSIAVVPLIFLVSYPSVPIYMVLFPNLLCGFMGSAAIVMVSSYAFLADHITDHNLVTVRMAILSVALSASMITGSYLAGVLLQYLTLSQTLCVVLGSLTIAFFYCLIRIEEKPPRAHQTSGEQAAGEEEATETDSLLRRCKKTACGRCCSELVVTVRAAKTLLKDTWHTFTQKRPRNHRAHMIIGVACFLVATLADFQGNVITLFVFRHPLTWAPTDLATWRAINGSVNLVGSLFGALILKRLFKVNDTTLILMGMICAVAQNITMGLSSRTWMVYLSSALGLFSTIVQPTIFSLTSRLVRKDEVGKAFAGFTLAAEIALILSVALLNAIYQATVSFCPGLVFYFVAGCVLLMLIPMMWVHLNYDEEAEDREKRLRDEAGRDETEDEKVEDADATEGTN